MASVAFQQALQVSTASTPEIINPRLQSLGTRVAESDTPIEFRERVNQDLKHIDAQMTDLAHGKVEDKAKTSHALIEYIQAGVDHYKAIASRVLTEMESASSFGDPMMMLRLQRLMAEMNFTIDFFSKISGQITNGLKTLLQNQ
jgi:hypothetical protein